MATRPAQISRSAWRGLNRIASAPKRAMSYRLAPRAMTSIPQHAVANGSGHRDQRRAHFRGLRSSSTISRSRPTWNGGRVVTVLPGPRASVIIPLTSAELERALAPGVHVADQQDQHEDYGFDEQVAPADPGGGQVLGGRILGVGPGRIGE